MTRSRSPLPDLAAAGGLAIVIALLAAAALWPIYQTPRLWLVSGTGAGLALAGTWLGQRYRWGPATVLALLAAFALTVLPVAVPSALGAGPGGLLRAEASALAAVALGWKQLLTLSLPLSTYQNVLVPAYALTMAATAVGTALMLRGGRLTPLAALPALAPVVVGTFFGAAQVSEAAMVGPLRVLAPREVALWGLALAGVAGWIGWASSAERRAALRRGRLGAGGHDAGAIRRGALIRGTAGGLILMLAVGAGTAFAPVIDSAKRDVPRDRIDPEIIARTQVSPLASYRTWKRDAAYDAPLFTVTGERLPPTLRLAVLDHFDGVDFTLGDPRQAGRFTRLPSASTDGETAEVRVEIHEGYHGVWAPIADLGAPPVFAGPRAEELADAFFYNRQAGAAVVVPTAAGLAPGDAYHAPMSLAPPPQLSADPASTEPLLEQGRYPNLERWVEMQNLPAGAPGLLAAVERLRDRGYLSHSLTDDAGHTHWLEALQSRHGARFIPSAGGHSAARIEKLFEQLLDQQVTVGEGAQAADLVSGIGDDEQFATAAALLARALGYDSRVVLGVRLGEDGVPGIPACSAQCEGRHISAWVEVRGADEAWVPLPVTPQVQIPPTLVERGEQLPQFATQPEERDAAESDPPVGSTDRQSAEGAEAVEPEEPGPRTMRMVAIILAAAVLLALPITFLPVTKRLRSRRRRARMAPELSVLSAWEELLDRYRDTRAHPPVREGRGDVAVVLGIASGEELARSVDRAVFAPEAITWQEAEGVWRLADEALRHRREQLSWWEALRAAYSLRSLTHRPKGGRDGR